MSINNLEKGEKWFGNIAVEKGVEKNVNAILGDNCGVMIKKETENSLVQDVQMEQKLSAPIKKGQKIGSVTYKIENKEIQTIDIIAEKEVKKETLMNVASYVFEKWFCLLR